MTKQSKMLTILFGIKECVDFNEESAAGSSKVNIDAGAGYRNYPETVYIYVRNHHHRKPHMITKDALMEKTDALIDQLRGEQISFIVLLFSPGGPSKIDSYAERLIDFQKEVRSAPEDDASILDLHKQFIVLERTTKRRTVILGALPSIVTLYVAIAAVGLLVTSVDIPKFIESTLGVKTPGKLITLGIAGAFVFLATTGLSRTETLSDKLGFSSVLHHTIRFALAIVVPIFWLCSSSTKQAL